MAQVRHNQTNFTAGEVSPLLYGRVDIDRYPNGAEELFNAQIMTQGGAARRPGSYYVSPAKNANATARLVPFKVSAFATYVIEIGPGFARFYTNRGRLEIGGDPVEIVLPYTADDLSALRFSQSGDTLFACHQSYPPQRIERISETEFQTSAVEFENGPWGEVNTSEVTFTPSAANTLGTIQITASAATFAATDVGRQISVYGQAQLREPATAYDKGEVFHTTRQEISRVWRVVDAGTTATYSSAGTTPNYDLNSPDDEGDYVEDGTARLEYLGRGKSTWGWGVITGFVSSTVVNVSVTDVFTPNSVTIENKKGKQNKKKKKNNALPSTNPTTHWRLGAWGGDRGYPRTLAFFQQRTWWGGSTAEPQTIWSSQSGDFYNMAPTEPNNIVLDTNAIIFAMDDDEVNSILWLLPGWKGLLIGTASGEHILSSAAQAQMAITPTNVLIRRASDRGSSQIVPAIRAANTAMFIQRGGRKLRELSYDFGQDGFNTPPASLISEHITGAEVVAMGLQEEPDGTIWLVREDGLLASLTYDKEQQVRGWARHEIAGGEVESLAVVSSPDGRTDDVYLLVKRTIGGDEVRYIEVVRAPFRSILDGENGGFFVDAGLTYDGTPATTFTGLGHLEGETVQICADGANRGTAVVSGGSVSIAAPAASLVHIGLGYEMRITPLPVEAGAQGGTAQSVMKKSNDCFVRLYESRGGEIGVDGRYTRIQMRSPQDSVNTALPLYSGLHIVDGPVPLWWDREAGVTIRQTEPLPMTVLSLVRVITANG